MFPKYAIGVFKVTPATPTSVEQVKTLDGRYASDEAERDAVESAMLGSAILNNKQEYIGQFSLKTAVYVLDTKF